MLATTNWRRFYTENQRHQHFSHVSQGKRLARKRNKFLNIVQISHDHSLPHFNTFVHLFYWSLNLVNLDFFVVKCIPLQSLVLCEQLLQFPADLMSKCFNILLLRTLLPFGLGAILILTFTDTTGPHQHSCITLNFSICLSPHYSIKDKIKFFTRPVPTETTGQGL